MSNIPEGYFYTEKHEWCREESDLLIVGITDYAQNSLGDIVYVDLQAAGTAVDQDGVFGAIESVKAAEDLYSPVTGEIAESNADINNSPEAVNKDPYGSWLIKLKGYSKDQLGQLMNAGAYAEYVESLEQ